MFVEISALRAAMKMANMDAVTDYMFTKPEDANGVSFQLHSNN